MYFTALLCLPFYEMARYNGALTLEAYAGPRSVSHDHPYYSVK